MFSLTTASPCGPLPLINIDHVTVVAKPQIDLDTISDSVEFVATDRLSVDKLDVGRAWFVPLLREAGRDFVGQDTTSHSLSLNSHKIIRLPALVEIRRGGAV